MNTIPSIQTFHKVNNQIRINDRQYTLNLGPEHLHRQQVSKSPQYRNLHIGGEYRDVEFYCCSHNMQFLTISLNMQYNEVSQQWQVPQTSRTITHAGVVQYTTARYVYYKHYQRPQHSNRSESRTSEYVRSKEHITGNEQL